MPKRGRILYLALAILFAISLTVRLRDLADQISLLMYGKEHVREPFEIEVPGTQIVRVEAEAGAAGILKGDTLLLFADRPYRGAIDFFEPLIQFLSES